MLAVRDQENLVHGQQQAAASKPLNQGTRGLQPKTPGNKYPKTPLRIPLNDENALGGFGKSIKGKGIENLQTGGKKGATFDKNAFITPMGPRTRAPLGMKTTNAKTKAFQTPAGPAPQKEQERTQPKQATGRRPKKVIHADSVKLEIHGDESPLHKSNEVEYCPPSVKEIPYESEDFPEGCLDYSVLKKENMMRGLWEQYHVKVDEHGVSKMEREAQEAYRKSAAEADEHIMKMMEEDWTVGDVPETFRHLRKKQSTQLATIRKQSVPAPKKVSAIPAKGPATVTSRRAVSALSSHSSVSRATSIPSKAPKPATTKPTFFSRQNVNPLPSIPSHMSTMRHTAAEANSRSTIGYSKGRSALSALHPPPQVQPTQHKPRTGLTRSTSNMSSSSDSTITPAKFAQKENEQEFRNPRFLEAFLGPEDDENDGMRGALPECMRRMDGDEDEEFFLTLA